MERSRAVRRRNLNSLTPSPLQGRAAASVEAFTCGQCRDRASVRRGRFGRVLDQGGALAEVVDAQRGRVAGGAAGGEDVVCAREVIARGFGGVAAKEDRACGRALGGDCTGLGDVELEVLWGE